MNDLSPLEKRVMFWLNLRMSTTTRYMLCVFARASDRAIRDAIHKLRTKGKWIVSDTRRGGYRLTSDPAEWDAFCDRQRRQMIHGMYRRTDENNKQLRITHE